MMLLALKKVSRAKYGSVLAKEVDCTYSHAVKILQSLETMGLVVFEKQGRIKIIRLTKRGQEVAEAIAKRDRIRTVPTGSYALNALGLSTQVPMNIVLLTDGSPREIKVGKRKIKFKKTTPKNKKHTNKK